jgi:branched-chain amino acid transport system permease protein
MVMIGGLGNHKGAVVGALVMTILQKLLSIFSVELSLMNLPFATSYLQYIVTGVILICVLIYRSTGLIPEEPLKTPAWEAVKHDTERST